MHIYFCVYTQISFILFVCIINLYILYMCASIPKTPLAYLPPCQFASSTTVMSSCASGSLPDLQPDHLSEAALHMN